MPKKRPKNKNNTIDYLLWLSGDSNIANYKRCTNCKASLSYEKFNKLATSPDGYCYYCKKCQKNTNKKRYKENKEEIKKKAKAWTKKNPEKRNLYKKKYLEKMKLERPKQYEEYKRKRNRQKNAYKRKYPVQRARTNLRHRLRRILKQKNLSKHVESIGCTIPELKRHIESHFQDGMTWDNYGLDGWTIDHIRPLADFDLSKASEQLAANHYSNLQPLWAMDNFKKGAQC